MLKLSTLILLTFIIGIECYKQPFQRKLYTKSDIIGRNGNSKTLDLYSKTYNDDTLFDLISVGTPENYFWISVETGFNKLWLIDSKYPDYDPEQNKLYNSLNSTTSKSLGKEWNSWSGQYQLSGQVYEDVFEYQTSHTQSFGLIQKINLSIAGEKLVLPFDGVLGLSWDPKESQKPSANSSPIINILDGQKQKIFTIWQDSRKEGLGTSNSIITFGAVDKEHCKQDITYFPLKQSVGLESLLKFEVRQFEIGRYTARFNFFGKLDTGLATISLPSRYYYEIQRQLSTQYNYTYSLDFAPCSKASTFPDWIFTIEGKEFSVPATEYVIDVGLPDDQCAVAFNENPYSDVDFAFGNPMLRKYCSVYDVDNGKVGLAEAIHKPYQESSTPNPF